MSHFSTKTEDKATGDLPKIPFELTHHEATFLEEALSLSGSQPSNLDRCQQRVVLKLRKQCRQLNDEDLGKLSVMLVNCLRQTEGRTILECSDTMSLSECLSSADVEVYNSYQQMITRCKAICIVVRQEQYRTWAENAVNKLTDYANEQILSSAKLIEAQNNLLEMINKSSNNVVGKEAQILNVMESLRNKYMTNMKNIILEQDIILKQHKQQIALSTKEFTEFTTKISSTNTLLIEQLKDIESSVGKLLTITNEWHERITNSSQWIEEMFGGISALRIFLHGIFLFSGMIILSFLQVDTLSRITLITFTIGHTLIDLYTEYGISFSALLGTLVCLIGGKYVVLKINWRDLFYVKVEAEQKEIRETRSSSRSLFTCTAYNTHGDRCSKPSTDGIYCQDHFLNRKHGR
ncbi:hypothetical protein DMENIID0001_113020 [Sergentomyia squamirostris]